MKYKIYINVWVLLLLLRMNTVLFIGVWWRGPLFLPLNTWLNKREAVSSTSLFWCQGQLFFLKKSSSPEKLINLLELYIYPGIRDMSFFLGEQSLWVLVDVKVVYRGKRDENLSLPPMLFDIATFNITHLKIFGWIFSPEQKNLVPLLSHCCNFLHG